MAVEVLGGRQDPRAYHGSGHWYLFRGREETKEEAASRLSMGEPKVSGGKEGVPLINPQLVITSNKLRCFL